MTFQCERGAKKESLNFNEYSPIFIFFKIEAKKCRQCSKRPVSASLIHVAFVNFQQVGGAKIQAVTTAPYNLSGQIT